MEAWIIMADVVDSKHHDQKELGTMLGKHVNDINSTYKKKISSPLTITLGDEFQGLVHSLSTAIKIIVTLQERLVFEKLTLRYVVYYGEIDTPINTERAYGMLGPGLTNARQSLNELKKGDQSFYIKSKKNTRDIALVEALEIFNAILKKWKTDKDKQLIHAFIKDSDYKMVSETLQRDRSQIWKRSKSIWLDEFHGIKTILKYLSK